MPLLQLPWEHRFSSIQSAVLAAVQEEKLYSLKMIQNTLFNLFFESKSLGDAASCITCTFEKLSLFEKYLAFPLSLWFNKKSIGDMTAIRLKNPQYDAEQEVQQYVDSAQAQIRQVFPAFQCLWGISESRLGPPDFGLLYANASLALQYCLNTKGTRHRLTYKDTKKALIVSVLSSHAEIQKNAREVLQPLLEYDANSNIGLLQTLTEFIRTSYNTSQTARNLHIHRQSLLYRLEKIQALTGMSLSEHDDLFVLETFSRIYASF